METQSRCGLVRRALKATRCAMTFGDQLMLTRVRWRTRTENLHVLHPVVKLADGKLLVGSQTFESPQRPMSAKGGYTGNFVVSEVTFGEQRWFELDADKVVVKLEVANAQTDFTHKYTQGQVWRCPVAHGDGNYFTDAETLARIEGENRVVFRYAEGTNPNGSLNDIAGIINERGNVLGLMPHPENEIEPLNGGTEGRNLFESVLEAVA